MHMTRAIITLSLSLTATMALAAPPRPEPPVREPSIPATELPDGAVPPSDANGNFIIGPTHAPAPEMVVQEGVPKGTIHELTMRSEDTTSHPAPYVRNVAVYVPAGYTPGTEAPFIVGADGPDTMLFAALDNLIAQKRVPAMVAISIGNGSGDAQGSQRGLEYDTMSGLYAEFVESEVLPLVERECGVKLTKDPEDRATMGCSSGGSCAMIMAWYRPDLYRRVLTFSGTYVNQQWPWNPETPHGAWGFHEALIPQSEKKPLRIWMHVGDKDLFNPNVQRDDMHDWVEANNRMAQALAAKGYDYQYVFAKNARHCEGIVKEQLLPTALEYVWMGHGD